MKEESESTNSQPEISRSEDLATTLCLNCEAPLLGDFCYNCGQKSDVGRFTFKTLLKHLYEAFRKFDAEVRNTFLALLTRPGEFCREYLAGRRKSFTDPFKYFFLSFAFYVALFGIIRYFSDNPEIEDATKLDLKMQLIILSSVFFWAVAYAIAFRQAGYTLAENVVCMLFLTSETRVFSAAIQLLILPLASRLEHEKIIIAIAVLIMSMIYFIYFSRRFYKESLIRTTLKNLLVFLLFLVLFVPVLFLELFIKILVEGYFK